MSGFWTRYGVPGHALHDKVFQRQMVSSQERRAAVTPRLNRGSTARCVPPSVYLGFRLVVITKNFKTIVFDALEGKKAGCLLGGPTRRRPDLRCRAPPCRTAVRRPAPPRPAVCPGFGLDG